MWMDFEDLSFWIFVEYVSRGVRRGDFDVIYVSGNTKVRVVESERIVYRWGIWYKANEGSMQEVPEICAIYISWDRRPVCHPCLF
jgi:hypothetical protein